MRTVWPIKQVNNLTLYRRDRGHEKWLPLYVVYTPDGRCLEEFRRLNSAIAWMKHTKDFFKKVEGTCKQAS